MVISHMKRSYENNRTGVLWITCFVMALMCICTVIEQPRLRKRVPRASDNNPGV